MFKVNPRFEITSDHSLPIERNLENLFGGGCFSSPGIIALSLVLNHSGCLIQEPIKVIFQACNNSKRTATKVKIFLLKTISYKTIPKPKITTSEILELCLKTNFRNGETETFETELLLPDNSLLSCMQEAPIYTGIRTGRTL